MAGTTYPINLDPSVLANIATPDGTMWFGPVHGSMVLASGQQIGVILGLEFVPGTNDQEASLTLEDLGAPAHLFFGAGFVQKAWGPQMQQAWSTMDWSHINQTLTQLGLIH